MDPKLVPAVQSILAKYVTFLETCDADNTELTANFEKSTFKQERLDEAKEFGDAVFALIQKLGEDTAPLLRYLVI